MTGLPLRICVTLTCFNRKEKTAECIRRLKSQKVSYDLDLKIILVDDGSKDGTSDLIATEFPDVILIHGDGSLYWNGGMRMAMETASSYTPNFFLWVNDDTMVHENALESLLKTHFELKPELDHFPIVSGSILDPTTGKLVYGGWKRKSKYLLPLRFQVVEPQTRPIKCDVFNGNFVLIPFQTYALIGSLSEEFIHRGGDYDYALKAEKAGITIWIPPSYHGFCTRNSFEGTWMDLSIPLFRRYQLLLGPKEYPFKSRFTYYRKYGGPLWFLIFPLIYARPVMMSIMKYFKGD